MYYGMQEDVETSSDYTDIDDDDEMAPGHHSDDDGGGSGFNEEPGTIVMTLYGFLYDCQLLVSQEDTDIDHMSIANDNQYDAQVDQTAEMEQ